MKAKLTLLFIIIAFTLSACGTTTTSLNNYNSIETVSQKEFTYTADTTYTFGDIKFDCSSLLILEDEDNGGTFSYKDPYISLSNHRSYSIEDVKLSTLYIIPDDAKNSDSSDYYIHGCPAYKDSFSQSDDYSNKYFSRLAFNYNDYTYTFICLTDFENKDICNEIISSLEKSLVFLETDFASSGYNTCVYKDISFYYSNDYSISKADTTDLLYGSTSDNSAIFTVSFDSTTNSKKLSEVYTEDLYSISKRTVYDNKEFDLKGNSALHQSFSIDGSFSSIVYVSYKGNDYRIVCVSPEQSIADAFITDFISSVDFL